MECPISGFIEEVRPAAPLYGASCPDAHEIIAALRRSVVTDGCYNPREVAEIAGTELCQISSKRSRKRRASWNSFRA